MIRRTLALVIALISATATLAAPSQTSSALAQAAVTVLDPISVVSNSYERAGGYAYDAVVVFSVRNSNPTQAAVNVPFRVTIQGGGTQLYDGQDTITVWPNETRLVAFRALDGPPIDTPPESASVQVYPSSSMLRAAGPSSQAGWSVTNTNIRCPGVSIECEVIGDLTWTGSGTRRPVSISAAITLDDGTVIAAGTSQINAGVLETGAATPFRASVRGFDQPVAARAPTLTDGSLTVKTYIESPP
jgi:hypothetical protein